MSRGDRVPARPASLRGRLLAFFEANPDEELTRADICAKFSAGEKNVDMTLHRMRLEGSIESAHVHRLPSRGRHAE